MGFFRFLARRILFQLLVVLGAITLTFFATKAIPGNPVAVLLGPLGMRDPQQVRAVTVAWKLDQPTPVQYVYYLYNIFAGNLGISIHSRNPVSVELATRVPATFELIIFAFLIAMAIAIPLGIVSATYRGSGVDHVARISAVTGLSAPQFWWAIIFLLVFYYYLGFAGTGRLSIGFSPPPAITGMYTVDALIEGRLDIFLDALSHIWLPAFTVGITSCGLTMRLIRASMLEVINSDFVRMARMKGLPERTVIFKHVLRNALIPVVTYVPVLFASMLVGSVLVETIFNWNGLGQFAVEAIFSSDYPSILGVTIVVVIVYSTGNVLADLFYHVVDPRVKYV
jgi:peptide/nickel transport system permease protein